MMVAPELVDRWRERTLVGPVPAGPTPHDRRAAYELVAWDWLNMGEGERLHAPDSPHGPWYEAVWDGGAEGRVACVRTGWLMIPGLFSRAGADRCRQCCRNVGMPPGKGSPKNDPECRPIVEAMLAAPDVP